jgi:hypothetical protein
MISEGFIHNGANVYISSRDAKACEQACKELNALGKGKADFIAADFYKEEEITRVAEELKKRAGSTSPKRPPLVSLVAFWICCLLTQTANRTRRPSQQLWLQLGRILRHLPLHRMGPRPQPQPQTRLPTHPSRHPSPRNRILPRLSRARNQHRQHRRFARPRPRNVRILGVKSGLTPHVARARESSGQEGDYE